MATPLRSRATDASGEVSSYRQVAIGGAAGRLVEAAWWGRAGWRRQIRVLPDGCADLVWNGEALLIAPAKPYARTYDLPTGGLSLGLRLRCGSGLLGLAADQLPETPVRLAELRERAESLDADLAASAPAAIFRRMIDLVLEHEPATDRRVAEAVRRLARPEASVAAVAETVGLTPREFRRRVRREVGYGPKALQRVLRFRRFHRALGKVTQGRVSLAAAALDAGYADQAHLSRECRELTGSTPAALARRNVQDD